MFNFKSKRTNKLSIYMKSGNVLELTHVVNYSIGSTGNKITKLELRQLNTGNRLLVETIDLDQIEAVMINY